MQKNFQVYNKSGNKIEKEDKIIKKYKPGLRVYFSGRTFGQHVQDPGFNPWHARKKKKDFI